MAHKAEILAPCGSFETLEAALRSGCDAVYLGGEKFSARQNAANFTDEQLKEAVVRLIRVDRSFNSVLYLLRKKLVCVYNFVLRLSFYNCACFELFFKVMDFCLKLSYFFLSFVGLTTAILSAQ